MLELRHVRSFVAVAEELHFGRAALRLHLAQSSLSEQVQRLERELGVVLVHRSPREVTLTTAGEAFRAEATLLLAQAERARAAAVTAEAATLSIGFNFPAGRHLLPAALARLAAEHPHVTTRLWERRSGPQLQALLDGTLDLAFVYGPPSDRRLDASLDSAPLLDVPVVAVVGRDVHPLATRSSLSMAELAGHDCILFHRRQSPAMHDAITAAAARAGVTLTVVDEVDDPSATSVHLNARPLVAFASRDRATGGAANGLAVLPLTDPTPVLTIHLAWRRGDTTPATVAFRAIAAALPRDNRSISPTIASLG